MQVFRESLRCGDFLERQACYHLMSLMRNKHNGDLTRVDREGVPRLVQWVFYCANTREYCVELFTGQIIYLDADTVRDLACAGYQNWDDEADYMAVEDFLKRFPAGLSCQ